jgi:hypothetical protein
MGFDIHLLIPDGDGPVVSNPHTIGPAEAPLVDVRERRRFVFACDRTLKPSERVRASGEAFAVTCAACQATPAFAAILKERPHPRTLGALDRARGKAPGDLPCEGCP